MSKKREFTYRSKNQVDQIYGVAYYPEGEPIAILQIAHGMIEHIGRYEEFAVFLADRGFLVVGNDHLGHGKSAASPEDYGFFAEKEGNRVMLRDMHTLYRRISEEHPDIPYFLLGHSMGSFLARQYLCRYGAELTGAIIMGTGWHGSLETSFGMLLCKVMAAIKGWRYRSSLIDRIAFGGFNRWLKEPRTKHDWLSKDEGKVDAYLSDPACQFVFTLNGYYNLFYSLHKLASPKYLRNMPLDLPLLFVSGEDDPVGNFGKGVYRAIKSLQKIGVKEIESHLYPTDRHEILNETDREQVFEDLYRWLEKQV